MTNKIIYVIINKPLLEIAILIITELFEMEESNEDKFTASVQIGS